MEGDCHCVYSVALVPDVEFLTKHIQNPAHTEGLTHSQPPHDGLQHACKWQQHDPVGNKGYEV